MECRIGRRLVLQRISRREWDWRRRSFALELRIGEIFYWWPRTHGDSLMNRLPHCLSACPVDDGRTVIAIWWSVVWSMPGMEFNHTALLSFCILWAQTHTCCGLLLRRTFHNGMAKSEFYGDPLDRRQSTGAVVVQLFMSWSGPVPFYHRYTLSAEDRRAPHPLGGGAFINEPLVMFLNSVVQILSYFNWHFNAITFILY